MKFPEQGQRRWRQIPNCPYPAAPARSHCRDNSRAAGSLLPRWSSFFSLMLSDTRWQGYCWGRREVPFRGKRRRGRFLSPPENFSLFLILPGEAAGILPAPQEGEPPLFQGEQVFRAHFRSRERPPHQRHPEAPRPPRRNIPRFRWRQQREAPGRDRLRF